MNELLDFLLSHLVDHADKIVVTKRDGANESATYLIQVDPSDTGKVIGKEGKIVRAIRMVAKIWAIKNNQYVDVAVVTDDKPPVPVTN